MGRGGQKKKKKKVTFSLSTQGTYYRVINNNIHIKTSADGQRNIKQQSKIIAEAIMKRDLAIDKNMDSSNTEENSRTLKSWIT